jgi:hypothetical protein
VAHGIGYKQLKRVNDWQLTESTQRMVLAKLVSVISGLKTTLNWGVG